ncbi:Imm10 family immunity protein [Saccharothrix sp.]|uniref:Imm10 family immunity protein n=1 Tax=Saccharothrix sp. TaxID=1873460 RepID=UPI00281201E4|nr:Imm10 family immunity protein [Saccharothrix sp.]
MVEVTARYFRFVEDEDDEVLEAGFAETEDGTGFVLLIQRSLYEPEEQEVHLGMDTYCLVSGGQSIYGGLRRAVRLDQGLDLTLSSEAAELLELPVDLQVRLDGEAAAAAEVLDALPRIVMWGREEERPELLGFDGGRSQE